MSAPLIDIVVLVHDRADWAQLCIQSIENFTKTPYRLIIVDMASVEEASKKLFLHCEKQGHTVLRLNENRSFSHGVNAGVNLGKSPYVCVFNDDALATESWAEALIQDASPKHIGLVGARSNFANGAQMDPNFIGEPPFLVFVCVAMRREVWDKVGPLDEISFTGFSSEDVDFSWRVKKAGFELKVSSAFVLHAGSRTLMATTAPDAAARNRNNEKYNQVLLEKWGKEWVDSHTKVKQNGLVASFHAEEMTRVRFMGSVVGLRNSGGVEFSYYQHSRSPIHIARQLVCDYAYDKGFDWLVMLDDDATFPPDLLRRFLVHQKEVVCALAYQRHAPYLSCAFEYVDDGPKGQPLEGIEHTGLRKVDVSGFHCSMIKTSVIKKLRDGVKDKDGKVLVEGTRSYFGGFGEKGEDGKPLNIGEDFQFSKALRRVGVKIYCDTDLISGHLGSPVHVDEGYKKAFKEGRAL